MRGTPTRPPHHRSAVGVGCHWRGLVTRSIDHYAVLGIDSDVDQEAVRQAWVATARINHPDALGDVEEVQRREAVSRMHAINEAWRILGSPDLRAEYDKASRGESDQPKMGSPAWIEDPFDMDASDPPGFEVGNPYVATVLRVLPWLVAGAIGVGIFVFSAFATNSRSERWTPVTPPSSIRCVVIKEDNSVRSSDCEDKSSRQVVRFFDINSVTECSKGTETVQARNLMRIYCLRPLEGDVDR